MAVACASRIAPVSLARAQRSALALLLLLLSQAKPLSLNNALVLGLDLFPVARQLVAFLWLWPEIVNGESVVEVRSEVVHDTNREHDIHAKLSTQTFGQLGEMGKSCHTSIGDGTIP